MVRFLKGNYQLPERANEQSPMGNSQKTLTESFEDSVLAKLGGSICFVAKGKTFLWTGDEVESASS
jgi:hypothetical protein